MKNFYFILIAIVGALGTFATIFSEHTLNTREPGSSRGWFYKSVLFLRKTWVKISIIFLTTGIVLYLTNLRDKIVESEAKYEQDQRDSITRKNYQDDREKSDRTIAEVLGENYLKLDTAQRKIVSLIQDSVNKKVNIDRLIQPQLSFLVKMDTINKKLKLTTTLESKGSNTTNINIQTTVASLEKNLLNNIFTNDPSFDQDNILPVETAFNAEFLIENYEYTDVFFFYFKGSYRDQKNELYPVDLIYSFDMSSKKFSPVLKKFRPLLDSYFKTGKPQRLLLRNN